ncbi:MAG: DUF502 domain-containing protein [Nitrospira sp.]|nr:DUF502 domain-containing protein [Nitrospira sp.]MCB9710308.1 DUF502 domain-containing protein [Nitrospiraceae bacterium]MDR4488541.1 DUF502 domain-containing protein [Nitrospirales bacterium]MCA9464061.1 DUF502 domain-containing protein [Nitrospira sp.]MCA9475860.1 DUF502 domain-containing protein [Nitrospira sp.]
MKRYFLTGLFIVVPAWGTILVLYTLFDALDHLTVDLFENLFGTKLPGTGVVSFVLLVLWTGLGATHLVGQRVHKAMERSLQHIPFVRSIYHTLKSMADVLKFRERFGQSKVVAFPFPRNGLWALGFDMGSPPSWLQVDRNGQLVMVFVPTAIHPFTGYLAFIPEMNLKRIRLRPEEAMKMEFSAGLYRPSSGWLAPATPPSSQSSSSS